MTLPKPKMVTIPTCDSPFGVGLAACNSNNKCNEQACDSGHVEGSTAWDVVKEAAEAAMTMATMLAWL